MDEFDIAQEYEMELRERQIAAASKGPALPATGRCYHCEELLTGPFLRFCDADCRDDYERAEQAQKRNGTPMPFPAESD